MAPGQVHGRPTLLSIRCGGGTQPAVGGNILFEANSNRHLMLTRGGTIDQRSVRFAGGELLSAQAFPAHE